jgi:hypothetical protein
LDWFPDVRWDPLAEVHVLNKHEQCLGNYKFTPTFIGRWPRHPMWTGIRGFG